MAYISFMEFIETSVFTKAVLTLLDDEEYRQLQYLLVSQPDKGDIIPGGGGIRKIRFGLQKRGKSGGVRVIYYWITEQSQIYLLLIYAKNKQENLTKEQTSILCELVKRIR